MGLSMKPTLYVVKFENRDSVKRVLIASETPEEAEATARPIFRDKDYSGTWTLVGVEPIKAFIIPNGHGFSVPMEEDNSRVATA